MFRTIFSKLLLLLCSVSINAIAADSSRFNHPLLSGPANYVIDNSTKVIEFGGVPSDVINKITCINKKPCSDNLPGFKNGKFIAEGKVTHVFYRNDKQPAGHLAILRSYEKAIKDLGGRKLSSDEAELRGAHLFYVENIENNIWILLDNWDNSVQLIFLEQKNMNQLVTAGQLSEQINKQGFANLNVNFDTNKSVIKDGDKAAINEVIALLKNDSKLKLSVEGHTDNVGAAGANKSLSQARSDSLVAYMFAAGIPAGRLVAKGFGSEVPVADNRTEEGKAKNRRVELVKIK
jgi:outer membrane protein OmpA-like peptidoglycan-associated protein